MGQYYNILTKKNNRYTVYDRSITDKNGNNHYMLAKLTEHSWMGNPTMTSFSNIIFQNPMQIAWVGDYCDDLDNVVHVNNLTDKQIKQLHKIGHHSKTEYSLDIHPLDTKYMLLVNWTKKEYLNMYEYIKECTIDEWCLHPLSLLTALGNGLGGGDYHGINQDKVGIWCFDEISFEVDDYEDELTSQGFNKVEYNFKEN